jgi:acyl carrier protein
MFRAGGNADVDCSPRNRGKNKKGNPMSSPSRPLVHGLVASHLRIDDRAIEDTHRFDELGLVPLDLVLVVLRLEDAAAGNDNFPVAALEHAQTVGDLVALVDVWSRRRTTTTV